MCHVLDKRTDHELCWTSDFLAHNCGLYVECKLHSLEGPELFYNFLLCPSWEYEIWNDMSKSHIGCHAKTTPNSECRWWRTWPLNNSLECSWEWMICDQVSDPTQQEWLCQHPKHQSWICQTLTSITMPYKDIHRWSECLGGLTGQPRKDQYLLGPQGMLWQVQYQGSVYSCPHKCVGQGQDMLKTWIFEAMDNMITRHAQDMDIWSDG
jgi:hypothetical protein